MSAIKEVLSRKMFSQGGLLGPEKPKEPTGILASSEPLMRAAKFANGGISLGLAPQELYGSGAVKENVSDNFMYDPASIREPIPTMPPVRNLSTDPSFVSIQDVPKSEFLTDDDLRYASDSASLTDSNARNPNYLTYPYIGRQVQPGEDIMKLLSGTEGLSSIEARERAVRADQRADQQFKKSLFPGSDVGSTDVKDVRPSTDSGLQRIAMPTTDDSSIKKIVQDVSPDTAPSDDSEPENIDLDNKPPEDNLKEKQSLESFLDKVKAEDLTKTDIAELKKKIAAAFDPLEESPTTEGLLLAELGASIMNKGFTQGLVDGLPKITAYHDAQFKAKQKRKDDVSALAVGEFIKDEGLDRDLEKNRQAELAKTDSYLLLGSNDDWSNAGYDKITATSSPKYLSARQAKALSEAGVNVVAIDDISKDLVSLISPAGPAPDPANYTNITTTPFDKEFGIATPIYSLKGKAPGIKGYIENPEVLVLGKAYGQAALDVQGLKDIVDEIADFDQNNLTGFKSVLNKAATAASGVLNASPGLKKEINGYLKSVRAGQLNDISNVDTKKRMLAAAIAPILLGESGKTISDQDRDRVALIIGLGAENADGLRALGGDKLFNQLANTEDKLKQTLDVLNESLKRRSKAINATMTSELTRHGRSWKDAGLTDPNPEAGFEFDATKDL